MVFEMAFQQGIRTKVIKYLEIITWDKGFHVSFQKFPLLALRPAWLRTFLLWFFVDLNLTRGGRSGKPTILKGGSLSWILYFQNKTEIDIAWIPGMHGYPQIPHYFFQTMTFLWGFLGNSHGCPGAAPFRDPPDPRNAIGIHVTTAEYESRQVQTALWPWLLVTCGGGGVG